MTFKKRLPSSDKSKKVLQAKFFYGKQEISLEIPIGLGLEQIELILSNQFKILRPFIREDLGDSLPDAKDIKAKIVPHKSTNDILKEVVEDEDWEEEEDDEEFLETSRAIKSSLDSIDQMELG